MHYLEPADTRATRLHTVGDVAPGGKHLQLPEPGASGVFRTSCGRAVHGTILTRGDEPSLQLCSSCRRRSS